MYDAALVVSSIYEGDPRGLPGEGLGLQYPLTFYSILYHVYLLSLNLIPIQVTH